MMTDILIYRANLLFLPLGILLKFAIADGLLVKIGDFLHIAIPAVSLIAGLFYKDKVGMKQCLKTIFITACIVQAIKWITHDMGIGIRPHGGRGSFPSGHTSSSFQGAFFLWRRYGWKTGFGVIGLALLTAYSRVYGQYHHWRDVIVGVLIALAVNRLWVTSFKKGESKVCP
jgi:membrane-associated phospholipid phosphatase